MSTGKDECIGYYNTVKYNILSYMKESNIDEMDVWCCKFTPTTDSFFENSMIPNKYRIKLPKHKLSINSTFGLCIEDLIVLKLKEDECCNFNCRLLVSQTDKISDKGAYICFDEQESIKEFNNQLYNGVRFFKKEIQNLQHKQNFIKAKIDKIDSMFINSDYTMEKLIRG